MLIFSLKIPTYSKWGNKSTSGSDKEWCQWTHQLNLKNLIINHLLLKNASFIAPYQIIMALKGNKRRERKEELEQIIYKHNSLNRRGTKVPWNQWPDWIDTSILPSRTKATTHPTKRDKNNSKEYNRRTVS